MNKGIRIVLADDHVMMRTGLKTLLSGHEEFTVVGEASTGREAVEMVQELQPDVVVMDVRMPDLNGFDAARQAIAARPGLKVIALSAVSDDKSTLEMVRAGAVAYVPKESAFDELIQALRAVMNNQVYFHSGILSRAANPTNGDHEASVFSVLSAREREVLQLIAEGKATKEVAHHLHVSVKTAETHRRNLMEKLGVDSVAELTKYAIREGLTSA